MCDQQCLGKLKPMPNLSQVETLWESSYCDLDCKTVSSFAGRSKIQACSSSRGLGKGNGHADGSKKMGTRGIRPHSFCSRLHVHFLFPVLYSTNMLEFSIFQQRKRLFCSLTVTTANVNSVGTFSFSEAQGSQKMSQLTSGDEL